MKFQQIVKVLLLLMIPMLGLSQSAKKYYKAGEKFLELKNYKDAINSFTSAINTDPNYEKAYVSRAACYKRLGELDKAIADYERALVFMPKEEELYLKAASLYMEKEDWANADKKYRKVLDMDKKNVPAIQGMIKVLQTTGKFHEALPFCEAALKEDVKAENYFNLAVTLDSLKSYEAAEKNYTNAKYYDSKMIKAYVGLAHVQVKLNKYDKALEICAAGLEKSPENIAILTARSHVYAAKNEFQSAVNDISKVIASKPGDERDYFLRASYYNKLGQYQNAVTDYSKVIEINDKHVDAYYQRAYNYEQMTKYSLASKDYDKLLELIPRDKKAKELLESVRKKLYEFNKEGDAPKIVFENPTEKSGSVLEIAGNTNEYLFEGVIKDASRIKSIKINQKEAAFNADTLNPTFSVKVSVKDIKTVSVEVEDIYFNKTNADYKIKRTEVDPPIVALLAPYASFDNEVYLDNNEPELYVEGAIKDQSLVKSVIVNGYVASFPLDKLNPKFSTKIDISNKDKILVTVEDIYGNKTENTYTINRSGANMGDDNPMGKTWVVFVENSNYQNFTNLQGPAKDIRTMKQAFTNYKVSNIIHKKNMTKAEMEKFFAIELRDLLKSNGVNSLLIWYAGHGKFINETGYWVPIDAKVDEEITYFNTVNMKGYLQGYSRLIHTLLVTDACESGPTFLFAMRGESKKCDWTATKFKSAQGLTSAGFELAADDSKFAQTFASSLNNNPNPCISIEDVFIKLSSTFKTLGKQEPKFGNIQGLPTEEGSFFFMKK